MSSRRHYFRFGEPLKGWPERRKGSDIVIRHVTRRISICHCAHRNDVGYICWRAKGHRLWARIPGRHHNSNTRIPGGHYRLIDGVIPIMRHRAPLKGKIQYSNVVLVSILDDEIDGSNNI